MNLTSSFSKTKLDFSKKQIQSRSRMAQVFLFVQDQSTDVIFCRQLSTCGAPFNFYPALVDSYGSHISPKSFHNFFLIQGDPRGIVNRIKKCYDWMAISPNPNSSLKKSAACFASDKQSCKILFGSGEVSPPPFRFLGKKVVGASQTHDLSHQAKPFCSFTPCFFFSPVRPMA